MEVIDKPQVTPTPTKAEEPPPRKWHLICKGGGHEHILCSMVALMRSDVSGASIAAFLEGKTVSIAEGTEDVVKTKLAQTKRLVCRSNERFQAVPGSQ